MARPGVNVAYFVYIRLHKIRHARHCEYISWWFLDSSREAIELNCIDCKYRFRGEFIVF